MGLHLDLDKISKRSELKSRRIESGLAKRIDSIGGGV